ncbi:flavodoxin [Bacillus phage BJ4]|nr:flavodoxin [Bacillus phage BJ4]AOZ62389.1 flavodoxin [Bacillus phage SBP8a]
MKSTLLYYSLKGNTVGILSELREEDFTYIFDMTGGYVSVNEVRQAVEDSDIVFLGTSTYYPTYQNALTFPRHLEKYEEILLTIKDKHVIIFGSGRSEYAHFCGAVDYLASKLVACNVVETFKFEGYPRQKEIEAFTKIAKRHRKGE